LPQITKPMKRFFFLTVLTAFLVTLTPSQANAQYTYYDGVGMRGKVIVGGNVGFGIRNYNQRRWVNFEFSPQVGYRIIDQLEIGTRIVYHLEYAKSGIIDPGTGIPQPVERYSCNYLGISPYINFEFWRGFYLQAEYEGVYGFAKKTSGGESIRAGRWYNNLSAGVGYRYYIGNFGFVYIIGSYNVFDLVDETQHEWALSPYNSPWIVRVGLCVGI